MEEQKDNFSDDNNGEEKANRDSEKETDSEHQDA